MKGAAVVLLGLALFAVAVSGQDDVGTCDPPCKNGGACTKSENLFFCKCKAGFWGETCTAKYEECQKGLVCYNGGACVADPKKPDQETCSCPINWTGATCKVPRKICGNTTANALTCMNGGECALDEATSEYYCACPANLRGRQCQLGVQECKEGMFCMNNGQCSDDGLKCDCPSGFFGLHCQNDERDAFVDMIPRKKIPNWAIALIVIASLIAVGCIGLIAFLFVRERRGRPVFKSWQDGAAGLQGTL